MPRFLTRLAETGNVRAAWRSVKRHVKSPATVYAYQHRCERFRQECSAACETHHELTKALEEKALW